MKKIIRHSYIKPHSGAYRFFSNLHKYLLLYIIIIILIILSYPTLNYFFYYTKIIQQRQEKETLHKQFITALRLKESLNKNNQQENLQDKYFSQVNQRIKNIIEKSKTKIENLQWDLDTDRKLYITFSQQSNHIFPILSELNALEKLYPTEILLTKLNQDRLIQVNAIFILKH